MVQMPGYFVDVYQAWSKNTHTFDYPLFFSGKLDALKGVEAANLKPMGQQPGYKLLLTRDPVTINGNWSGVWSREANTEVAATRSRPGNPANEIKVTVLGDGETRVFDGIAAVDDRQQRTVLRRTGTSAVFEAVIEPFKESHAVKSVVNIKVEGPVPGYGLKVARADGGTDLIIVRLDPQKDRKPAAASMFESGTTDALVAVVRMDGSGKVIEAGMIGGTKLVSGDKTVAIPEAGIKWEK
jgi:hypothetical protein